MTAASTPTGTPHRAPAPAERAPDIHRAVADIAAGRPVVLVDDMGPDNGGDLIFAAELATPQLMAFTVRTTSGFVCVALTGDDCDRLDLPRMTGAHPNRSRTDYTVTVDARHDAGTGISATDRARTVALLGHTDSTASDFTRPGHVVPIRARPGGVLSWPGRAEAAVDLATLAGLRPATALCGLVSRRRPHQMAGSMDCADFAAEHGLTTISTAAVAAAACELSTVRATPADPAPDPIQRRRGRP